MGLTKARLAKRFLGVAGTRARGAVLGTLLMLTLVLPSVVGAGTRIPVDSVDDAGQPRTNRTAAVTNIVVATNARLGRVINAYPPNPCADVTEPTAQCDAALAAVFAYDTLATDVVSICAARPIEGIGASVIDDADVYAADTSPTGIANQLASITTVLGNADRRLGSIYFPPNPVSPPDPIVPPTASEAAALVALFGALATGDEIASRWLNVPPNPIYPPNPCSTLGS